MSLLSHSEDNPSLSARAAQIRGKIVDAGDRPHATVREQLDRLDGMLSFDLGRFMVQHRGINGYWTEYICTHPARRARGEAATIGSAERDLLERCPSVLATQERYRIFQVEIGKRVRNGCVFASVPCGLMCDLLGAPWEGVAGFRLIGVDLDPGAIEQARAVALAKGLVTHVELRREDAWSLGVRAELDLIASNGLTMYEPDDVRVTALYRGFHAALKPGGTLLTSVVTPSPEHDPESTWIPGAIDPEGLRLQRILFEDIVEARFLTSRSTRKTREQLRAAGFSSAEILLDTQGMFPTVVAIK